MNLKFTGFKTVILSKVAGFTSLLLLITASAIAFSSCGGASGPVFVKADFPESKSVIYFYRESRIPGAIVEYNVRDVTALIANKTLKITDRSDIKKQPIIDNFLLAVEKAPRLARITNGDYYPFIVSPGTYYFILENAKGDFHAYGYTDVVYTVTAKKSEQIYVKTFLGPGGRPFMEIVTEDEGSKMIKSCTLALEPENK
jgi:hypothetical protein